jgi:hypothetical protein
MVSPLRGTPGRGAHVSTRGGRPPAVCHGRFHRPFVRTVQRVTRAKSTDTMTLAEVTPLTLERPSAPDASSVRRDLEGELEVVAAESLPSRVRQHDARPGAAAASAAARESFPEAYETLPFLVTSDTSALRRSRRPGGTSVQTCVASCRVLELAHEAPRPHDGSMTRRSTVTVRR